VLSDGLKQDARSMSVRLHPVNTGPRVSLLRMQATFATVNQVFTLSTVVLQPSVVVVTYCYYVMPLNTS